jgi:hypothetical protein
VVEIMVLKGSANKDIIVARNGAKILGQAASCVLGISEEGWVLNNELYTFVYDASATNWHVL